MLSKRILPAAKLRPSTSAIFVKVGGWFEASATGWGVLVVPFILVALIVAAAVKAAWL